MKMATPWVLAAVILVSPVLSAVPGKTEPLWIASRRSAIRRELREGAREIRRERREAFREIMRSDSPRQFRREVREGMREIRRERREMRREVRREMRRLRF
jgi:CHASE3 domain sensor protein